ncbi:hypothetical protein MRB56_10625 [Halomonas cupida]|uniref:hypothetical protein n=1 Tax=Halomonas cupida TaxID=44933 RepID=UPI0011612834|nr:hypothetical protein [Halomonas cupida]
MAAQECVAVGHPAVARLRQWGADDNQIDQDELFDCHVNNRRLSCNWYSCVSCSGERRCRQFHAM